MKRHRLTAVLLIAAVLVFVAGVTAAAVSLMALVDAAGVLLELIARSLEMEGTP